MAENEPCFFRYLEAQGVVKAYLQPSLHRRSEGSKITVAEIESKFWQENINLWETKRGDVSDM